MLLVEGFVREFGATRNADGVWTAILDVDVILLGDRGSTLLLHKNYRLERVMGAVGIPEMVNQLNILGEIWSETARGDISGRPASQEVALSLFEEGRRRKPSLVFMRDPRRHLMSWAISSSWCWTAAGSTRSWRPPRRSSPAWCPRAAGTATHPGLRLPTTTS
ncbi:MAG: hypothetical protein MZV64_37095 [Ignavibacteriales bacterium]|nr:hypothetical protein [Ignavibacteriales bacterium]